MYPHVNDRQSKTMEGHGTEAMAQPKNEDHGYMVTTRRNADIHDCRANPQSRTSALVLQSIKKTKLKGGDVERPQLYVYE